MGIANRTDFDLKQHAKFSGKSLTYFDEETQGARGALRHRAVGRRRPALLAFLSTPIGEEEVRGEKRVVLRFHPELAPVKVAVLPLLKKRAEIVGPPARAPATTSPGTGSAHYDDTAAIGRLYRRQDEIGTPYCVTVDVQTVGDAGKGEHGDGRVTIRDRDSMEQIRVPIPALVPVLRDLLEGGDGTVAGRFGGVPALGASPPPRRAGSQPNGRPYGLWRLRARRAARATRRRGDRERRGGPDALGRRPLG